MQEYFGWNLKIKWPSKGDFGIQVDNLTLARTGLMSGLAVAFASSLCRAFVNSYTLVKGNTLAQEAFTRELEVVEERWVWACVPECTKVRVGEAVGRSPASRFPQPLLVAVMCKQLYWNWVSSFTSGIHLEERWTTDGRAVKLQAVPPQVHVFSFCASCLIFGSGN